jgi:hypothetical protein
MVGRRLLLCRAMDSSRCRTSAAVDARGDRAEEREREASAARVADTEGGEGSVGNIGESIGAGDQEAGIGRVDAGTEQDQSSRGPRDFLPRASF